MTPDEFLQQIEEQTDLTFSPQERCILKYYMEMEPPVLLVRARASRYNFLMDLVGMFYEQKYQS